jgi:exopolysaccharide biosynthesis polyprenyl glycosylphosphotransferase
MYRLKQLTLLAGDVLCLYLGLYIGIFLRYLDLPGEKFSELATVMTVLFLLALVIIFIAGLYDISKLKNSWSFYQKIIISALVWIAFGMIYFYINPKKDVSPKTILLLTAAVGFGLMAVWRFYYNKFIAINLKYNIIFAGITQEVNDIIAIIQKEPQRGYSVIGVLHESEDEKNALRNSEIIFGTSIEDIQTQANAQANIIVLAPGMNANKELLQKLYQSLFQHISIVKLSDFYETIMGRIPPFTFSEGWFVANLQEQEKKVYDRFRILADYIFGIIIGLLTTLLYPFIALAIKLNSKGPVLFMQNRVGRQGAIFTVYKFRTMQALAADGSAETSGPQFASKNDQRITAIGKFLRLTRLDEIPQCINILRGEMSIIGPRPERPEFVTQLTENMPYYSLRHLIKPGLTGWAQVNKSYYGTLEENIEKLEYDLYYIKNRNLTLDISIILRTINTVLRFAGR